jgi:diguanylate cyclase (GGDEF)-like protein
MQLSQLRLFLITFALVEILATLVFLLLFYGRWNAGTESFAGPVQNGVPALARQITAAASALRSDIANMARHPDTVACLQDAVEALCRRQLNNILAFHPDLVVQVVSAPTGTVLASGGPLTEPGKDDAQARNDAHWALAAGLALRAAHPVSGAGGAEIGEIIVAQPIPQIYGLFESLPHGRGYAELRQYASDGSYVVLLRKGDESLRAEATDYLVELGQLPWRLAVWDVATAGRGQDFPVWVALWLAFSFVLILILTVVYGALRRGTQTDLNTIVNLVSDIRRSRLSPDYPVRLSDFGHAVSLLRKLGRLMVGRQIEVTNQASLDHLSQVHNRRSFEVKQREIFKTLAEGFPHSLLIMDIDRFKHVNDTYGHDAGDRLIVEFGKELKKNLRTSDFIARLGGDEFCVIFPNTPLERAAELADRLRKNLPRSLELGAGIRHELRWSGGLSEYNRNDHAENLALTRADSALLDAKRDGRNVTRIKRAA